MPHIRGCHFGVTRIFVYDILRLMEVISTSSYCSSDSSCVNCFNLVERALYFLTDGVANTDMRTFSFFTTERIISA